MAAVGLEQRFDPPPPAGSTLFLDTQSHRRYGITLCMRGYRSDAHSSNISLKRVVIFHPQGVSKQADRLMDALFFLEHSSCCYLHAHNICTQHAVGRCGNNRRSQHRYQILAAEAMEGMAERLEELHPDRFRFHKTSWGKFPDGTDNIEVGK